MIREQWYVYRLRPSNSVIALIRRATGQTLNVWTLVNLQLSNMSAVALSVRSVGLYVTQIISPVLVLVTRSYIPV